MSIDSTNIATHSTNEIVKQLRVCWNTKKPGQAFYSLQSLLNNPSMWNSTIEHWKKQIKDLNLQFDAVVGIASRGLINASILAYIFNVRLIIADKKNKLPKPVYSSSPYTTEYSSGDVLEICCEAFDDEIVKNEHDNNDNSNVKKIERVLVADDLLATGGSFSSIINIVEKQAGRKVVGLVVIGDIDGCTTVPEISSHLVIKLASLHTSCKNNPDPMLEIRDKARKVLPKFLNVNNEKLKNQQLENQKLKEEQIVLISHPSLYSWVKTLQFLYPTIFVPIYIQWREYPDKTPNIDFKDLATVFNNDSNGTTIKNPVIFLFNTMDMAKLFEQISLLSIIPDYVSGDIHTVIPYYSVGTQERFSTVGQLAAGNTLAKMISAPITRGPIKLTIYDLHYPSSSFNFGLTIKPNYNEASTTGIIQLLSLIDVDNITIAYPDSGAYKRFSMISALKNKKLPTIIFFKKRDDKDPKKRSLYFQETENFPIDAARGTALYRKHLKHVLIIDDLVQSGRS